MTRTSGERWTCGTGVLQGAVLLAAAWAVGCQAPSRPLGVRPGGPISETGLVSGEFIETRSEAQLRFEGAAPASMEPYTALFEAGDVHMFTQVAMPSGALLVLRLAVFPLESECLWGEVEGRRVGELQMAEESDAEAGMFPSSAEITVDILRDAGRTTLFLAVPEFLAPDLVERAFEVEVRLPQEACFER